MRELVAILDRRVPRYLAKLRRAVDILDEVKQRLAVRLLVAEGGRRPALAEYGGRGSLDAWLRISATRVALELGRGEARRGRWEAVP